MAPHLHIEHEPIKVPFNSHTTNASHSLPHPLSVHNIYITHRGNEKVPVITADDAKVGVAEHPIHDPHNPGQDAPFRIERRHQHGHICGALVVHQHQSAFVQAPGDVVALLHDVVASAPGPQRHHGQEPAEEQSLDVVVINRRSIFAQWCEEPQPNNVCGDAVQVVGYDQDEPDYSPDVPVEV